MIAFSKSSNAPLTSTTSGNRPFLLFFIPPFPSQDARWGTSCLWFAALGLIPDPKIPLPAPFQIRRIPPLFTQVVMTASGIQVNIAETMSISCAVSNATCRMILGMKAAHPVLITRISCGKAKTRSAERSAVKVF